jgi:hypothetical protein
VEIIVIRSGKRHDCGNSNERKWLEKGRMKENGNNKNF